MENLINEDVITKNMKSARTKAGYTQTTAAEALGLTKQTISNWEREPGRVKFETFLMLAQLYNVKVTYFFGR